MPDRVVDASVLGAFIFQEPRADEAEKLLRGHDLYAPTLLLYELTNIAWKKLARGDGNLETYLQALETTMVTQVKYLETVQTEVLQMAVASGLTGYDASYLWVARRTGMEIVTFDGTLHAAARRRA